MANEKVELKSGMGGSSAGRGRTAKTAVYKAAAKKKRRKADKKEAGRGLDEG